MKRSIIFLILVLLLALLIPSIYGQIQIISPEDDIYTPEDQSYNDYKNKKAHFLLVGIKIDELSVNKYKLYDNDVLIGEYDNNELNHTILFTSPGIHSLKAVGYDQFGKEVGNATKKINLLFDYFDLYSAVDEESPIGAMYEIVQKDLEDAGVSLDNYLNTIEYLDIEKEFIPIIVKDKESGKSVNHTIIRIKLNPKTVIEDLDIYELIPKEIAANVNEIIFDRKVKIININDGTLALFEFEKVDEDAEILYYITKELFLEDVELIKTIPIGSPIIGINIVYWMIPLIVILLLAFVVVYFVRFRKE